MSIDDLRRSNAHKPLAVWRCAVCNTLEGARGLAEADQRAMQYVQTEQGVICIDVVPVSMHGHPRLVTCRQCCTLIPNALQFLIGASGEYEALYEFCRVDRS